MDDNDYTVGHCVRSTRCGQGVKNRGLTHKRALLKGKQYLLHTKEWVITYGEQSCELYMEAYTDSVLELAWILDVQYWMR